jgi:hypothetical protein
MDAGEPGGSAPGPCRLPGGDVEAVEDVGRGDHEDQRREPVLVVVAGGLVPDLVGHGIGPVLRPGQPLTPG